MEWKDSLRQLQRTEKLDGLPLVRRFIARSHNSPNLPRQAYDGNDPMPLLRRLTPADLAEFRFDEKYSKAAQSIDVHLMMPPVIQAQPVYTLRVHVICCADDDGSNSFSDPTTVAQWIGASLAEANAIYAARGAGIRFVFDAGDVELLKSTMVNQDFIVSAGTDLGTGKDTPPLSDAEITALGAPHENERNRVCLNYPDRCVFLLCAGTSVIYDSDKKMWVIGSRGGYAYSWEDKEFVNFPSLWGALHGPEVAHETGHYLHLWHPFGGLPKSIEETAKAIRDYVAQGNPPANALVVFDGDLPSGVADTAPDPGPDFYAAVGGAGASSCDLGLSPEIAVNFGGGASQMYFFTTDRGNVMSYFKDCATFQQHYSQDQINRMRAALVSGNRRRLVGTQLGDTQWQNLRYGALWNADQRGCVWWPICTEVELRQKTAELWPSMRLRQMSGFVLNGQVRFACLWEPGAYPQVWWPNCSEQELRATTEELWSSMRPVQTHAFVVNGQARYSCIWTGGTYPQVWWPNCSEQEFRDKTGELWGSMRPSQMCAFVIGGEVRYSALWKSGIEPVVWWPNCSEQEFRDKTGELWTSMRPAQLQPYSVAGQLRFAALWRAGTMPQIWWPSATEEQVRQTTQDTWDTMRPMQWLPAAL
jgi:hypothetical protein